ncbi:MAG: phosphohydrolase [Alphaproteobacteria bacterium]|nr:phosphohydrolase [Alphaproteobacteria bacterium]
MPRRTPSSLDEAFDLLAMAGTTVYEPGAPGVSLLEHALQCGENALAGEAAPGQVMAALFHDIGHLVVPPIAAEAREPANENAPDRHEEIGADWLSELFPASVTEPIRLHVEAKRYLCATRPDYVASLSDGARRALTAQGGPMSPGDVHRFTSLPFSEEAVRLRLWDEAAKVPGRRTRPLADFRPLALAACV